MRHCTARALGLLLTLPLLAPGPLSGLQSTVPVIRAQPQALTRFVSETADSLLEPIASLDVLEAHLEWEPGDFEARWRAARAALVLGVSRNTLKVDRELS